MDRRYLAVAAAALLLGGAAWHGTRAATPREAHMRAEAIRLREHFDIVDRELRARDVSHLTAEQRARRARLVEWLRDYRNAGRFPLNDGYADAAVPIFRDADGTLCAMAYLIERAGRGDIVDRVARSRNTAYIRELVDDPELVTWLDRWGLSAAEAGRIQPRYRPPLTPEEENAVDGDYALASVALAGASLVTSWVNVARPSRISGFLGLVGGSMTLYLGLSRLDENPGTARVGAANAVIGAAALGIAIRGLLEIRDPVTTAVRVGSAELRIAPDVLALAGRRRAGLTLTARF